MLFNNKCSFGLHGQNRKKKGHLTNVRKINQNKVIIIQPKML